MSDCNEKCDIDCKIRCKKAEQKQPRFLHLVEDGDKRTIGIVDLEDVVFAWIDDNTSRLKLALRSHPITQEFANQKTSRIIMDAIVAYRKHRGEM